MNKSLLPLFLLALIAAGGAFFLLSQQKTTDNSKQLLFEELGSVTDQVSKITLTNAQGTLLSVERVNGQWLAFLDGVAAPYPADQEKLSTLMTALLKANLSEAKTQREDKYERLGVRDLSVPDSQATLLTLEGEEVNLQVLIGSQASSGSGSYARKPQDKQSWLLDRSVALPTESQDWLEQPILGLAEGQVLSLARVDDPSWRIVKIQGEEGYILEAQPQGRELQYDGILDSTISNLTNLRFDQILSADEVDELTFSESSNLTFEVEALGSVSLMLGTSEEEHFVRFSVADPINAPHWHNLTYQISSFAAGQLNKQMEDFLQEVPTQQEQEVGASIDEGESPQ